MKKNALKKYFIISSFINLTLLTILLAFGINSFSLKAIEGILIFTIIVFANHLIIFLLKLIFSKSNRFLYSGIFITNIPITIILILATILFVFYPKESPYPCLTDEERKGLIPGTSKKSYSVPGIYILDRNTVSFVKDYAKPHKFYFLPDSTLILEIGLKSWSGSKKSDSLIFINGKWYLNKEEGALMGDWGVNITTFFPEQKPLFVESLAINSFKIRCENDTAEILLKIPRHNLGNTNSLKIGGLDSTDTNLDYLNSPNLHHKHTFGLAYKKIQEITPDITKYLQQEGAL